MRDKVDPHVKLIRHRGNIGWLFSSYAPGTMRNVDTVSIFEKFMGFSL